jgi:hypothetical protein
MDGRSDMYGDKLLKVYLDVAGGDPASIEKTFKRYDIQWTIMTPASGLAKALDKQPGWRRFYADKWAVVHVRQDALPTAPRWPATFPVITDGRHGIHDVEAH